MQIPVEFLRFFPAKAMRTREGEMRHGLIWLVMALAAVLPAFGATVSVNLGSASSFGLLGSTISDTGTSVVLGNVGATTTITGFPPGTAPGFTVFAAPNAPGTTVGIAYSDFETAYNTAYALANTQSVLTSLGTAQTFTGNNVYTIYNNIPDGTIATTSGTVLTFDAQNNPNEVFVIQIDEAFTVNGLLQMNLTGGAQANNIFWIVKDAATISVSSNQAQTFDGSILAGTSFTMSASGLTGGSGVLAGTINGCVFAETANTLAGETDVNGCVGGGLPGGGPLASIPEPGSSGLVSLGCVLGILAWRKLRVSR
jgi:hypothetical protein